MKNWPVLPCNTTVGYVCYSLLFSFNKHSVGLKVDRQLGKPSVILSCFIRLACPNVISNKQEIGILFCAREEIGF